MHHIVLLEVRHSLPIGVEPPQRAPLQKAPSRRGTQTVVPLDKGAAHVLGGDAVVHDAARHAVEDEVGAVVRDGGLAGDGQLAADDAVRVGAVVAVVAVGVEPVGQPVGNVLDRGRVVDAQGPVGRQLVGLHPRVHPLEYVVLAGRVQGTSAQSDLVGAGTPLRRGCVPARERGV